MDLFAISCETCHARLNVHHEDAVGQIHPCPRCGSMVLVQRSVVEDKDSMNESRVRDGLEPSAADEHRDSAGIPASPFRSKVGDLKPVQHDGAVPVDVFDSTTDLTHVASVDSSPASQEDRTPELRDVHSHPEKADVVPAPDAAWANSGQVWIWNWMRYGVAMVVGIAGSVALCTVVIIWNHGARNDPMATESQLPPASPKNRVVEVVDSVVSEEQEDEGQASEEALQAPVTVVLDRETTSDTNLADVTVPSPKSASDTLDLSQAAAPENSQRTVEKSVPLSDQEAIPVVPGEATSVSSTAPQIASSKVDLDAHLGFIVPAFEVDGVELHKVIQILSDLTTIPITLQPEALLLAGRTVNSPVRMKTENRSVDDILKELLGAQHLSYFVQRDQIVVTNKATDADGLKEITYPIGDLLEHGSTTSEQLVQLITTMVRPDSWQKRGGLARLVVEGDSLVIEQTGPIHWEILKLCEKIRFVRGLPLRSRRSSERFELTTQAERAKSSLAVSVSMNYVIPTRLVDMFGHLEKETKVQVLVNWLSASEVGVEPDFETTFVNQNRSLGQSLQELLFPLGLAFRVVDKLTLQVVSQDYLEQRPVIELYHADDWLLHDSTAEQLVTQIESTLGVIQSVPKRLEWLPDDRLLVARLSQSDQSRLVEYLRPEADSQ